MKKLTLAFALLLTASAAAHAQMPTRPSNDPLGRDTDPRPGIARDEINIGDSRSRVSSMEREADRARRSSPGNLKAEFEVTNNADKAIKSVAWTATITNADSGDVIQTQQLTTNTRIDPGKTKKLSKRLKAPRADEVKGGYFPGLPFWFGPVKVEIKSVTYVDGSTSTTP
ncbi:MAG TPA: hypothetical protein VF297_13035 [Pyrinomonadaceae bacterium]